MSQPISVQDTFWFCIFALSVSSPQTAQIFPSRHPAGNKTELVKLCDAKQVIKHNSENQTMHKTLLQKIIHSALLQTSQTLSKWQKYAQKSRFLKFLIKNIAFLIFL